MLKKFENIYEEYSTKQTFLGYLEKTETRTSYQHELTIFKVKFFLDCAYPSPYNLNSFVMVLKLATNGYQKA